MPTRSSTYSLLHQVRLHVSGPRAVVRHFDAEYGPPIEGETTRDPQVDVAFRRGEQGSAALELVGGHKTVRWTVLLPDPDGDRLRASIEVSGRPLSFGLSLVQGYFVEPLVSLAASGSGSVLLPSAAIVDGDAAVLIIGRSRSGKSSVTVRALAAGKTVLGDDQVFVDASGGVSPFPRRLRFYADIADTAPVAYRKLRPRTRATLAGLALLRRLTRGVVAPPVRVPPGDLGRRPERGSRPLARVVLVERGGTRQALDVIDLEPDVALAHALAILDEQRSKLAAPEGSTWEARLARAREQDADILRRAFQAVPVERVSVPAAWGAPEAIAALSDYIGAER